MSGGSWPRGGFGIYIHWPFCAAKCPYCDFNSHVRREVDQSVWREALVRALEHEERRTEERIVSSVFFGGGTPSLMEPETVAVVIETIRRLWPRDRNTEITLEANPTSVEAGRFRAYAEAGVNRLSMGVQALNDADLRALGRMHTAEEARAAFDVARGAFDRVSFDLIYARPGQTLEGWRAELREALSMAVDHFSLYQLTIEPGTRFADLYERGKLRTPPDDDAAALYDATQEICANAGLPAYEISNHARPGAECRHNLLYWRYGDYVGVGPGAHGRLTTPEGRIATEALRAPEVWLKETEKDGVGSAGESMVTPQEQAEEYLMMALRLNEGADPARFRAYAGGTLDPDRLTALKEQGLLEPREDRLIATQCGRLVLNALLAEMLA